MKLGLLVLVFAGCGTEKGSYIPEGDSDTGREALARNEVLCLPPTVM